MSVHQTKDGRWYTRYWEDGRYHKKYFGRGKAAKVEAEDYDLKVKRLKKRAIKVSETEQRFKPLHFDKLAQLYLNDRKNSGWSEKQAYDFKAFTNRYVIPSMGHKLCSHITMADLIRLKDYIAKHSRKGHISPNSINRYVSSTKAVFGWGFANDLIPSNPWAKHKKPREKAQKPNLLTLEELHLVLKHAAPHCRWALDVAFNTGCRPGPTELFKLEFTDVNWEAGELLIRSTKTEPRIVKLRPEFMKRLRRAYENRDCEHVVSYKGQPVKKLRRSFKTALEKAGINKRVRLYDIRHMYGTFMAKRKADLFAIQELMGHSNITTTRRYLHHAEALKADAVENCLPSLDYDDSAPQAPEGGNVIDLRQARGLKLVPKTSPQKKKHLSRNA